MWIDEIEGFPPQNDPILKQKIYTIVELGAGSPEKRFWEAPDWMWRRWASTEVRRPNVNDGFGPSISGQDSPSGQEGNAMHRDSLEQGNRPFLRQAGASREVEPSRQSRHSRQDRSSRQGVRSRR